MSNTIVQKTSSVDFVLTNLVARFENQIQDIRWRVEECNQDWGPGASMATLILANTAGSVDEAANTMAFNINNMSWLRMGLRCSVDKVFPTGGGKFDKQTVFVGSVVDIDHDRDRNALVVTLLDDRWLLNNVRVVGRWIYDPKQTGGPFYQEGWGAHFNPGGRPNKIYGDPGGNGINIPMFTPYPDFGLVDGQQPPSSTSSSSDDQNNLIKIASYWTLQDICNYLWNFYSAAGYGGTNVTAQTKLFPWIARAPANLIWPKEYAASVDSSSAANFDNAVGQTNANKGDARKGRELILEGLGLLDALHLILNTAGGYTISIEPSSSTDSTGAEVHQNTLTVVQTRFLSSKNGASVPMAFGGPMKGIAQAAITGGSFKESGRDYMSAVAGAGQKIFIERMLSTKTADGAQLRISQSAARFTLFKQLLAGTNITITDVKGLSEPITAAGTANSTAVWTQALRLFPEILSTWRPNETFDFQAGTDQANYPRAPISRPPWPTLLSLLGDAGGFDFAGMHAPVYVEVETSDGNWTLAGQFDAFEVMDNGNIYLPMMREQGAQVSVVQYNNTDHTHVVNGMLDISVRNIRMALAIPCDHRLTYVYATANDGVNGTAAGPNSGFYLDNPDVDRIATTLKRRDYRDLQELYACWLRKSTFSRPQTLGWPQDADKPSSFPSNQALRSDIDMLGSHIKRAMWEVNRLQKSGLPRFDGYLITTYRPGMQIKEFTMLGAPQGQKPFPVNSVCAGFRLSCLENKVFSELKF